MPQFQLKGRSRVPSLIGGIFALAILAIMALYALIKLNVLLNHENPNVSTFLDLFAIDQWEKLALPEKELYFAWSIEGYLDEELKDDPRYVKYIMRMRGRRNGIDFETLLDYHKCTPEELE